MKKEQIKSMNFDFPEDLAYYVLIGQPASELPKIALKGLEHGYESPSLVILAGFSTDESVFLIDEYFRKVLLELNLNFSERHQAAIFLIRSVINKVLYNNLDVYEGCKFIFNHIGGLVDLTKDDRQFAYDNICLEEVYGMYVSIGDITNSNDLWSATKSNEEVIDDLKADIKEKFSKWNLA